MKVVLFATPQFCIPILLRLNEQFDLVGVVTAQDKKSGRGQTEDFSPIKKALAELDLKKVKLFTPKDLDNNFMDELKSLNPDIFVVASYGKILPKEIVDLPRLGSINIHPSLLPKYRGASPIQSAILNGDKITGLSIIKMDERMDHGPVLKQFEWEVKDEDTFETLSKLLFEKAALELPGLIEDIEQGKISPKEQDESMVSYCKTLTKDDGYINPENAPEPLIIKRMVRAFHPWPGVWTKYPLTSDNETIVKLLPEGKIQVEGKKALNYKDFANGYSMGKELLDNLGLS